MIQLIVILCLISSVLNQGTCLNKFPSYYRKVSEYKCIDDSTSLYYKCNSEICHQHNYQNPCDPTHASCTQSEDCSTCVWTAKTTIQQQYSFQEINQYPWYSMIFNYQNELFEQQSCGSLCTYLDCKFDLDPSFTQQPSSIIDQASLLSHGFQLQWSWNNNFNFRTFATRKLHVKVMFSCKISEQPSAQFIQSLPFEIQVTCADCALQRRLPMKLYAQTVFPLGISGGQLVQEIGLFSYQQDLTDCPCPLMTTVTIQNSESDSSSVVNLVVQTLSDKIRFIVDQSQQEIPQTFDFYLRQEYDDGSYKGQQIQIIIQCTGGRSQRHLGYPNGLGREQWKPISTTFQRFEVGLFEGSVNCPYQYFSIRYHNNHGLLTPYNNQFTTNENHIETQQPSEHREYYFHIQMHGLNQMVELVHLRFYIGCSWSSMISKKQTSAIVKAFSNPAVFQFEFPGITGYPNDCVPKRTFVYDLNTTIPLKTLDLQAGCTQPCSNFEVSYSQEEMTYYVAITTEFYPMNIQYTQNLTVNVQCVLEPSISSETSYDFLLYQNTNNTILFSFTCADNYCCQNNDITYSLSLDPDTPVSVNSQEFSSITDFGSGNQKQFTVSTSNLFNRDIYVRAQSTSQPGTTVYGKTAKMKVSVICHAIQQIKDQPQLYDSIQYVPPNQASFQCEYFSISIPVCLITKIVVIEDGDSTQSQWSLMHIPDIPQVSPKCEIRPLNQNNERKYTFKILMEDMGGISNISLSKSLVVGCRQQDLDLNYYGIPFDYYVNTTGGPMKNFNISIITTQVPHCQPYKTELVDVKKNNEPDSMALKLSDDCKIAIACSLVDINDTTSIDRITFNVRTYFPGLPTNFAQSDLISISIMCGQDFYMKQSINETTSYRFYVNTTVQIEFPPYQCSVNGCCPDITYQMSNTNDGSSPDLNQVFQQAKYNESAGLMQMKVDTTNLGSYKVYIFAKSVNIFNYSVPILVEIDFPCEFDEYYIKPERSELESKDYFMVLHNLTRFVFVAKTDSHDKFEVDLSHRFTKRSPDGQCEIIDYVIQKVLIHQSLIPETKYLTTFSINKQGVFSINKFDVAIPGYFVMISPCNRLICGNLGSGKYNYAAYIKLSAESGMEYVSPEFTSTPELPIIKLGEISQEEITYKLPNVKSLNEAQVKLIEGQQDFLQFDSQRKTLKIIQSQITESKEFNLKFELTDSITDIKTEVSVPLIVIMPKQKQIQIFQQEKTKKLDGGSYTVPTNVKTNEQNIEQKFKIEETLTARMKFKNALGDLELIFNEPIRELNISNLNRTSLYFEIELFDKNEQNISTKLKWMPLSIDENKIHFKFEFEDPLQLSQNLIQDKLILYVIKKDLFYAPSISQYLDPDYQEISCFIKKQIPDTPATEQIGLSMNHSKNVMNIMLVVSVILNLFTTGNSMICMLMMIRSYQMILHLPMFKILFPGNVTMVFDILKPLVAFDILEVFMGSFELEQRSKFQSNFDFFSQLSDIGYEPGNIYLNLNSIAIFLILYILQVIIWIALSVTSLIWPDNKKLKKFNTQFGKSLFFNYILAIIREAFFEISMSAFLNIAYPSYDTIIDTISLYCSYILAFLTQIIFPVLLVWASLQSKQTIESQSFQDRWRELITEIKVKNASGRLYHLMFIFRREMYIVMAFALQTPIFQILGICYLNVTILIYQGGFSPLQSRFRNRIEIMNEMLICLATFQILCFTDFVSDLSMQFKIGYLLLSILGIQTVINLFFVMIFSIKSLSQIVVRYKKRGHIKWLDWKEQRLIKDIKSMKNQLPRKYQKRIDQRLDAMKDFTFEDKVELPPLSVKQFQPQLISVLRENEINQTPRFSNRKEQKVETSSKEDRKRQKQRNDDNENDNARMNELKFQKKVKIIDPDGNEAFNQLKERSKQKIQRTSQKQKEKERIQKLYESVGNPALSKQKDIKLPPEIEKEIQDLKMSMEQLFANTIGKNMKSESGTNREKKN